MKELREKYLSFLKIRGPKYKGRSKTLIERKIDNILMRKVITESITSITSLLNGIPYVIVGGHAVTIHGHPRTTDDVDIMTTHEYVNDIVDRLNLDVTHSLTIGGVAATTPSGIEIDILSPDQPWVDDAIKNAEDTKYGKVVSKPYLVLMKIYASRSSQDDNDIIIMLQNMNENEQELSIKLVDEYFSNMSDDIRQMLELAKLGFNL